MRKTFTKLVLIATLAVAFSSCSLSRHAMREPNSYLELKMSDFVISDQVSAEATTTRVFGIDWARLFNKKMGDINGPSAASIPVIGSVIFEPTVDYSLYNLMQTNPGYDVVLYPQYETKVQRPIGLGFIIKTTTVKTTARLGKLAQ